MYVFMGMQGSERTNRVDVMDVASKEWAQPRCDGTGRDYKDPVLEPAAEPGELAPDPLPPPRMYAASWLFGSVLFAHGGEGTAAPEDEGGDGIDASEFLPEGDENPTHAFLAARDPNRRGYVEKTVLLNSRPSRICLSDCWSIDTAMLPLRWVYVRASAARS
jgi:hypothetical protein